MARKRQSRSRSNRSSQSSRRNRSSNNQSTLEQFRQTWERLSDYTPIQPTERIRLETTTDEATGRVIDLITPIGKGQRCMITSPPKAGKTMLLQTVSEAISKNHPDIYQVALLIDERPEEATDFKRNLPIKVVASTTDAPPAAHRKCAEKVFLDAIERMIKGEDVVILLDSLTRLARTYNNLATSSSKTLSGGVTAGALDIPRQLFGAARNLEEAGSLTIIATALVDTGSRMDEVIFQEFKGTGNMELVLTREFAQRRLWPAVDIAESGTRREADLFDDVERLKNPLLRRKLADMSGSNSLSWLLERIQKTRHNKELLKSLQ